MIHKRESIFLLQKLTISIVLALCFTSSSLQASDKEEQIVLEIYPQWYSNENYTVQGNIGIQKVYRSDDWVTYYTKPSISYALDNNWALHGGLGLYYTDYQDSGDNVETRPYIGVSHFYPWSDIWRTSMYFRTEERFQDSKEDSTRLRLRIRTDYIINPLSKEYSWHKFTFGVEGFKSYYHDDYNVDSKNTYDRESIVTLGLERSLSEQDKIRFELAWKYQAPPGEISSSNSNTVYFKVQYYPQWGKKWRNRLNDREIDQ